MLASFVVAVIFVIRGQGWEEKLGGFMVSMIFFFVALGFESEMQTHIVPVMAEGLLFLFWYKSGILYPLFHK